MKDDDDFKNAKRGAVMSEDLIIEAAEQDLVDAFELEVMEILHAIDFPEAFVTDLSQIYDFIELTFCDDKVVYNKQKEEETISIINSLFDNTINVLRTDKLGEIARKLNFHKKSKTINWFCQSIQIKYKLGTLIVL